MTSRSWGPPCEPPAHPSKQRSRRWVRESRGRAGSDTWIGERDLYGSQRDPRGEHHSRAGTENTLPGGSRGWTGADHRTSHSPCPISLQLPQTGLPNTGQMRTEWRYILKRSYFSLLSRFCFFSTILRLLFISPRRLHHNVPESSYARGSQFTVRRAAARPAGRQAPRAERGCSNHQEGEGNPARWPSLPPKEVSVCAVFKPASLQPPGEGLLCRLGVGVSQRFLTLKAETKQVPRHAIQFT